MTHIKCLQPNCFIIYCCLILTVFSLEQFLTKGHKAFKNTYGLCITIAFLDSKLHISHHKNQLAMALSAKYCKRNSTRDLYTNEQGNILTRRDIIFYKKQPFVVTEEGNIDHYSSGAMGNIFQAPDSEFETL